MQSEEQKCILSDMQGVTSVVSDVECNPLTKPSPTYIECPTQTACDTTCGDLFWEDPEQCEVGLDASCCLAACTSKSTAACITKNKVFDAAFMMAPPYNRVFIFQGLKFGMYLSDKDALPLVHTYISEGIALQAWSGDLSAAFVTSDCIAYFFKDFSYVRVNLLAFGPQGQLDASPVPITKYSIFGVLPDLLSFFFILFDFCVCVCVFFPNFCLKVFV